MLMDLHVALSLPSRSSIRLRQDRLMGAAVHAKGAKNIPLVPFCSSSSLLNHCFNNLWTCLHNLRRQGHEFTHWALLHDDILPEPGWIHTLITEMDRKDADFISAIAPIKDDRGLTSTAMYDDDIWDFQRLTMKEVMAMPETVTAADFPGKQLLLNTGCCVLRMKGEWVDNPRKFPFETLERIDTGSDGDYIASVVSEDWLWTDKLRKAGAKLAFTRKVSLAHEGDHDFRNDSEWGRWNSDKAYEKRHANEDQVLEGREVSAERSGELAGV